MVKGDYGNKYRKSTVNEIVPFLDYLNLKPSKKLQQEYLECDLNRRLNELPSLKYLNLEFKDPMDSEVYEKLKKRFYSRPPYNYFLNSNIKFDRITNWGTHHYIWKRHDEFVSINWCLIYIKFHLFCLFLIAFSVGLPWIWNWNKTIWKCISRIFWQTK